MSEPKKFCTKCGETKPWSAYKLRPNNRPRAYCEPCDRAYYIAARRARRAKRAATRPPSTAVLAEQRRRRDEHGNVVEKQCSLCGEWQGVEAYRRSKDTLDKLESACRYCERERAAKKRERLGIRKREDLERHRDLREIETEAEQLMLERERAKYARLLAGFPIGTRVYDYETDLPHRWRGVVIGHSPDYGTCHIRPDHQDDSQEPVHLYAAYLQWESGD